MYSDFEIGRHLEKLQNMDWYSQPDLQGMEELRDASMEAVASNDSLNQTDILVRESLQNSLDAAAYSGEAVKVVFQLKFFRGDERAHFLESMDWAGLEVDVWSHRKRLVDKKRTTRLVDPAVFASTESLPVLFISDYATRGLRGREFPQGPEDPPAQPPHCFVALCRNIGDNEKGPGNSGGTHGFGKTVYWKNSGIATVLFDSVLQDYWYRDDGSEVRRRFFGVSRLKARYVSGELRNGPAFLRFGTDRRGRPLSAVNDTAETHVDQLQFPNRGAEDSGTTIAVIAITDPDDDEVKLLSAERAEAFLEELLTASERWFWPAINSRRLVVQARLGDELVGEVHHVSRPELLPYVKALHAAKHDPVRINARVPRLDFDVPVETAGEVHLGFHGLSSVDQQPEAYKNRVALVRGPEMVVGYQHFPRKGLNATDFVGVALAGAAVSREDHRQKALDLLLARSEPVTHDKWSPVAEQLKGWRGASSAIRSVLDEIKKKVQEQTGGYIPLGQLAAPELSKLLAFGDGGKGDGPKSRVVNIQREYRLRIVPCEDDPTKSRYEVAYEIEIPAAGSRAIKKRTTEERTPTAVRVSSSIGYLRVSSSRETRENLPLERPAATPNEIAPVIDGKAATLTIPITPVKQKIILKVQTRPLPNDLVSRLRMQDIVRSSIGYGQGGDSHA